MHLLRAVLPSWDLAERAPDMAGLVQQLFSFLGGLLTTCSSDAPLLRGGLRPGPAPRSGAPAREQARQPLRPVLSCRPRGEAAGAAAGVPDGHTQ